MPVGSKISVFVVVPVHGAVNVTEGLIGPVKVANGAGVRGNSVGSAPIPREAVITPAVTSPTYWRPEAAGSDEITEGAAVRGTSTKRVASVSVPVGSNVNVLVVEPVQDAVNVTNVLRRPVKIGPLYGVSGRSVRDTPPRPRLNEAVTKSVTESPMYGRAGAESVGAAVTEGKPMGTLAERPVGCGICSRVVPDSCPPVGKRIKVFVVEPVQIAVKVTSGLYGPVNVVVAGVKVI